MALYSSLPETEPERGVGERDCLGEILARLADEGVEGEAEDGLTLAGEVVLAVNIERARDVGLLGVVCGQLVVIDSVWLRDLRWESWRRRRRQQRREREER